MARIKAGGFLELSDGLCQIAGFVESQREAVMILRLPRFQAHGFAQLLQRLVILIEQAVEHGQVVADGSGGRVPSNSLAIVFKSFLRFASGNKKLPLLQLAARLIGIDVKK